MYYKKINKFKYSVDITLSTAALSAESAVPSPSFGSSAIMLPYKTNGQSQV